MRRSVICVLLCACFILFSFTGAAEETISLTNYANLKGRGSSDVGRSEPQYVGQKGFLGFYGYFTSDGEGDRCYSTPWYIPTYQKDKQFWVEAEPVEHKTEVEVLFQELTHEGYGAYSGMLLVKRIDDGKEFYVDVMNFITKPYWSFSNLREATRVGYFIAEFKQKSDYYPVGTDNSKKELEDGTLVLVTGLTDLYGRKGPDRDTHPIEGMVWKKWKYGYGGVNVFFSEEDLTLIY